MEYVIGDETIIEYDVKLGKKVSISQDIELPVISISHDETPLITPIAFNNIGVSSVDVSFDVSTENATEVVKGLIYSDNAQLDFNDSYKLDYGQGTFDLTITGLRNNTTYYFKPYALSNLGYKYGNVQSCHTQYSPIPNEYQLVEYLESTGTQYINTGYYPNMTDTIEVTYALTNLSENQGYGCISTNPIRRCHTRTVGVANAIFYSSSNFISYPSDANYHTYKWDLSDVSIDGTYSHRNENVYPDYEFYLFARNSNDTVSDFCKSRCKGFKVYNILEMYPVYRKSDSKPGMYDILTNELYTNAGTGEFIVGPDKEWEE